MNRIKSTITILGSIALLLQFVSCKKTTEKFEEQVSLEALIPPSVGKVSYFRLDSGIIQLTSNTPPALNQYLLKEVIAGIEYDNTNHPMLRVERFLSKDLSGNGTWSPDGFYHIAYYNDRVEVLEKSLRFIKLAKPVRPNYNWKGNLYLPDKPYAYDSTRFSFSSIEANMRNWAYTYTAVNATESVENLPSINGVTTVEQINIPTNIPDDFKFGSSPIFGNYASQELSVEKYAKDIGLVYRQQSLWEYQFNNNSTKIQGFYLKMWRVNQ